MTRTVQSPQQTTRPQPTEVAVQAINLVKTCGSGATTGCALDHANVTLTRGAFTAVMGPSGSGKSP